MVHWGSEFHTSKVEREKSYSFKSTDSDVIIRRTVDGILIDASPSIKSVYGYDPEEVIGKSGDDFIHPEDVGDFLAPILNREIEIATFTYRVKHASGKYVWTETTVTAVGNMSDSHQLEILSISRDITARKRVEEQLVEAENLSLIGKLAAGVAHEIRNPLTTVKGFLQLLTLGSEMKEDYLALMLGEIERIEHITQELMLLAKPSKQDFKRLNIIKILEEMIYLLETEAFKQKVKFHLETSCSPIYTYGDETKLKQVFINLIKNGIEAMETGGLLQVKAVCNNVQNTVEVEVIDEGGGMSIAELEKLGEPFYTTKKTGHGLGLMMCFNIIQEHRGQIKVQSEVGMGTIFKVILPKWQK